MMIDHHHHQQHDISDDRQFKKMKLTHDDDDDNDEMMGFHWNHDTSLEATAATDSLLSSFRSSASWVSSAHREHLDYLRTQLGNTQQQQQQQQTISSPCNHNAMSDSMDDSDISQEITTLDLRDDGCQMEDGNFIDVKIKLLNGTSLDVMIENSATILDLKHIIQRRSGMPVQQQRLVYRGRLLNDLVSCNAAGLVGGSVCALVLALRGGENAVQSPDSVVGYR